MFHQAAASSSQRLVVCPTRPGSLPWAAGYAEVDTFWIFGGYAGFAGYAEVHTFWIFSFERATPVFLHVVRHTYFLLLHLHLGLDLSFLIGYLLNKKSIEVALYIFLRPGCERWKVSDDRGPGVGFPPCAQQGWILSCIHR